MAEQLEDSRASQVNRVELDSLNSPSFSQQGTCSQAFLHARPLSSCSSITKLSALGLERVDGRLQRAGWLALVRAELTREVPEPDRFRSLASERLPHPTREPPFTDSDIPTGCTSRVLV